MPIVSDQLQEARNAVKERFRTMSGWLEAEDLEAAAEETGLALGTIKQIKKGAKWNQKAVEFLINQAKRRQTYYEQLADVPLDEETGKPILKPPNERSSPKR